MSTIPKRMMFFWGNQPMSWLRYMTLYSFRKFNPDWSVVLYTCPSRAVTHKEWDSPEKQDFFTYSGPDYFPKVKSLGIQIESYDVPEHIRDQIGPSRKSNFFKWDVMGRLGGWYSDMDILWVKPLGDVHEWVKSTNTVLAWNGQWFSIGLLASIPGNPFFQGVFQNGFKMVGNQNYQCAGVLNMYNYLNRLRSENPAIQKSVPPHDYFNTLHQCFPDLKLYNLPMNLVYPWVYNQMDKVFHHNHPLPPDTVGIHWYAGCDIAQEYNCTTTELNFSNSCGNSTISHALRRVLDHSCPDPQSGALTSWIQEGTRYCRSVVELGAMNCRRLRQISNLVQIRIGVEISPLYVSRAKSSGCVVIQGDARGFDKMIDPKMNDCVMMLDFIEHIPKKDGLQLITKCKKFFKKILISTPEGPYPQDGDPCGEGQDEWQKHRSAWTLEELKGLGFIGRVYPNYYPSGIGYAMATWTKGTK